MRFSYQTELMRVEEAYINKIEYYKAREPALIQEEQIKGEHKVEDTRLIMQTEIDRLTVIINLYKDKLNRRESENRNLLVELKIYKEKVEKIRLDFIDEIKSLKAELERKTSEWGLKERDYLSRFKTFEMTINEHLSMIESLRLAL